jgi:hypothetical protein
MFQIKIIKRWLKALLLGAALAGPVHAAELAVGDPVPVFSAKDQFGKEFQLPSGRRFLLLGFEMSASKAANGRLAGLGAGWLEQQHAAYVLDIHTMPAVARFFALPKMRKYPQRIVLGEDEKLLAAFPRKPDRITVLVLTPEGKIQEIRYWNPVADAPGIVLK